MDDILRSHVQKTKSESKMYDNKNKSRSHFSFISDFPVFTLSYDIQTDSNELYINFIHNLILLYALFALL